MGLGAATSLQRLWVLGGVAGELEPPAGQLAGALAQCKRKVPNPGTKYSVLRRLEVTIDMMRDILGPGPPLDSEGHFKCQITLENERRERWPADYVGEVDRDGRLRRYLRKGLGDFAEASGVQVGAFPHLTCSAI